MTVARPDTASAESAALAVARTLPGLIREADVGGLAEVAAGLRHALDEALRTLAEIDLRRGRVSATRRWMAVHTKGLFGD